MSAKSSAPPKPPGLGRGPSTPMTVYCIDPMRTFLPIGSMLGKSACPRAVAEHDDLRRCSTSAEMKTRPASSLAKLTADQFSVAPRIADLLASGRSRSRRATGCCPLRAQPHVDERHRRAVALDRARVLDRQVRAPRHFEEALAARGGQSAELLDDDRVRSELADRVAQRLVEAADERRHADDRRDADDDAEHRQRRAHLARAQGLHRHHDDLAEESGAKGCHVIPASRASIGSSFAACIAGYIPKNSPTTAVTPMPMTTDQTCTDAGSGENLLMIDRQAEAEERADHPAERRERHRLGQDLPDDVAAPRAERLAQPDLARPLAHHHQHDVHDDDAADDQRQPDDADEDGEDALGRRVVDAEQRVGREHPEVVGILRPQPALDAQRHGRVVHRRLDHLRRLGLDHQLQARTCAFPNIFWKLPIGMIAKLSCELPEHRALLLVHADDAEMAAVDRDRLVDRVDRAEELVGDVPPMTTTGRAESTSTGLISRPRSPS